MGTRGPVPLSSTELKLRGSYRRDRHAARESSAFAPGAPTCPSFITGRARELWDELTALLADRLTPGDRAALCCLVESIVDFESACDEYKSKPTPRNRSVKRMASDFVLKVAAQFGLTPATRSRVPQLTEQPQQNTKARFFNSKG